ncbi:MAG: PIN domain-containing protein [Actinomycetales bacterium]|nr:PIN domain-containing protein [Actinomycetales bacterium]
MLLLDVNVVLHAYRPDDSARAAAVKAWLSPRLVGHERVGVSELVLSSMIRIATSGRIYTEPAPPAHAVAFADALLAAPAASVVRSGPRHWAIFGDLVSSQRLRGNDVPDAYLAALALEQGATLVTLDRGFARFDGLKTLDPLL